MGELIYVIIRKVKFPDEPDFKAMRKLELDAFEDYEMAVAEAQSCVEDINKKMETGVLKAFDVSFEIQSLNLIRKGETK